MGALFVELAVLAAVLSAIAYPLMFRRATEQHGQMLTESGFSDLMYLKETAYTALVDLDFDHKTGKIDDADYNAMKTSLEAEAIQLLSRIEEYERGQPAEPAPKPAGKRFCHQCGREAMGEHVFCSNCGAKL